MTKRIVISGYYGFGNFGDEAILSVLVNHLKSLDCEVTVLSSNTRFTENVNKTKAINSFKLAQVNNAILKSDILISGGGSLLQDTTSLKSILYYLFIIILAIIYRKKVIIFAQGIGPINNVFAKLLTRICLKLCTYVSVRDIKSKELLDSWKVKSDLTCDPIFSIDSINTETKENAVGVQLRNFPTLTISLLNKLASQIAKDFSDKTIYLLSFQDSIDLSVCRKFEQILLSKNPSQNIQVLTGLTNEKVINSISKLEYLIAMRYHALIIALKAGVKSSAINYDIKVEKLAQEANLPIISMNGQENLEDIFNGLKELDENELKSFANSKQFNWNEINKIILNK